MNQKETPKLKGKMMSSNLYLGWHKLQSPVQFTEGRVRIQKKIDLLPCRHILNSKI